jgi:hypothetical protein
MSQRLSRELVDRLFARFSTIYGAQKMAAMWGPVDRDETAGVWGDALGRYPLPVIGKAVQALMQSPGEWPPTLPQFIELCRQYNRPEHQQAALPAPGNGHTDAETARRNLARIHEMLASAVKRVPA